MILHFKQNLHALKIKSAVTAIRLALLEPHLSVATEKPSFRVPSRDVAMLCAYINTNSIARINCGSMEHELYNTRPTKNTNNMIFIE